MLKFAAGVFSGIVFAEVFAYQVNKNAEDAPEFVPSPAVADYVLRARHQLLQKLLTGPAEPKTPIAYKRLHEYYVKESARIDAINNEQ